MSDHDVIVVGEGITGLTAALACARAGLTVATVERELFGGLVTSINELVDWNGGTDEPCSGSDLATALISEAADAGVVSIGEAAVSLASDGGAPILVTDVGRYPARALIVASGATRRMLGVAGEDRYRDRGLSFCADCDGPLVKGADVVVVGGGDSALQEAAVLAHYAGTVHLVHRGTTFRARPAVQAVFKAAFAGRPDALVIHWSSTVVGIEGANGVETVIVLDLAAPDGLRRIPARAVYPCVGLDPSSGWTGLELAADGAIITGPGLVTSMPGVHAAGAVRAGFGGRLADAAADGEAAARSVIAALVAR